MSEYGPQITINVTELQKRRIFVATPMYGGQATGLYTKSCVDLQKLALQHGVHVEFFFIFNESLIPRARNYLVDEFLRATVTEIHHNPDGTQTKTKHKYTHLMFIDGDIGFDPNDVLALAAIAEPGSDKQIVCGPYAKKTISWEKIKVAVDKGHADEDPNNLEKFVGDYVFNPADAKGIRISEVSEVLESGTGFMMIQREALEKFKEAYPQYSYLPDHVRSKHFDGSREIHMYFQAEIDPESKRYLSEDYWFCQQARKAGIKVWLCPWMNMIHQGSYLFGGSLPDMAMLGVSATAANDVKRR